jgi:hypothetical protein
MTDVIVSAEAVEEAKPAGLTSDFLDDQLISQLVDRARADGIKFTGEGGLLQLTKLRGLPDAIEAIWPQAITQTCVVHLIRASFRYAARQDWDRTLIARRPADTV